MSVCGQDAYPDLLSKPTATLKLHARNHALADGNQRTATTLTLLFLRANGHRVPRDPHVSEFVVKVASGRSGSLAQSAGSGSQHAG